MRSLKTESKGNFGYSTLEFVLVIPVLTAVTLGAYNVMSALHAYHALSDATKRVSDCISPTDGSCSSTPAAASPNKVEIPNAFGS